MQVHGPSVTVEHPGRRVRARLSGRYAVLEIGPVYVHLDSPQECDWLIAAAAEAKRLLDPPVIPPAERDCPALNPDGDWPCHRGGQHDEHEDDNGSTWTSATERAVCGIRHNAAGHALCTREPGHPGGHKNTRTGDYWPAAVAS